MFKNTFAVLIVTFIFSCTKNNVLLYKHKKYYKENNIITSDTIFTLYQKVCYNKPGVIDEEFCYSLKLEFLDTNLAKSKRIIDLQSDTLILKASYGLFSVWNWENEETRISGQIEIIKWNPKGVIVKEHILCEDIRTNEINRFLGTRVFTRKDGW